MTIIKMNSIPKAFNSFKIIVTTCTSKIVALFRLVTIFIAQLNVKLYDKCKLPKKMFSAASVNSKMCGICRTYPISAAFVPCGHSSFCYTCALTISALPVCLKHVMKHLIRSKFDDMLISPTSQTFLFLGCPMSDLRDSDQNGVENKIAICLLPRITIFFILIFI